MDTCQSCGRDERTEDLVEVQRVYVRAESWRDVGEAVADGDIDVRAELELWCVSCRSQYPHHVPEA